MEVQNSRSEREALTQEYGADYEFLAGEEGAPGWGDAGGSDVFDVGNAV